MWQVIVIVALCWVARTLTCDVQLNIYFIFPGSRLNYIIIPIQSVRVLMAE